MMVDSWLERSGSLPLHILIAQWHLNSFLAPQNLLNRLVPFCNRLQSLCLALPLQCLPSFLDRQPAFPVLNKIDLTLLQNASKSEFSDVIPNFPQCRRFTTFLNALQLRTVKLNLSCSAYGNSSFLAQTVFMIPLPLNQLHSLHLELRDPGDYYSLSDARSYFDLLRNCQHTVVECRFSVWNSGRKRTRRGLSSISLSRLLLPSVSITVIMAGMILLTRSPGISSPLTRDPPPRYRHWN
ncbi:hypothetical protein C8R41DRAFT_825689 [Lentinula lateritia]|uniref:F-box domain-containing protein n=1 Tax=Lentinula lateritia TaxID=40482 RepID=A0ABQ8VJZ5_9AGAR|nr:hypothetical protein C8R41DRAFT_825689 [Lentinula lateritia]